MGGNTEEYAVGPRLFTQEGLLLLLLENILQF